VLPGSVCEGIARIASGPTKKVGVEHPSGEFTVDLELDPQDSSRVTRAALLRTARLLMRGEAMVPGSLWRPTARDSA